MLGFSHSGPPVWAGPVGLVVRDETSPQALAEGLRTCTVRVLFDDSQDNLLSVGFADITTNAPDGFFQSEIGIVLPFDCFGCSADLTDDGLVNAPDLAVLLGAWGPNPGHPADLNADEVVDPADLAVMLAGWGTCP